MVKRFRYYLEKFLAALKVKVFLGGLEISDLVLRLAYYDGREWHLNGVRLEPGVMEAGKVKDRAKFVEALVALKAQVQGPLASKKKVSVIVSLSSVNIYTHAFSLPLIEKESLEEAIQLNVQMVSPVDITQVYYGWQIIGEDKSMGRVEVLSSFLDRTLADDIRAALSESGFISVAVEPKSLSLTRLLMEEAAGFDAARPYVMVQIDSSGLTFLIVSKGHLYFEYFNPWKDIADEKGEILMPAFEAMMTRSVRQVTNFYSQHWTEPLTEIILSAPALGEAAAKVITANFSLVVKELKSKTEQPIGPEWFVALGSGLRGLKPRRKDKEMSLSGLGAEDEFRREQLLSFLAFWRVLIPATLAMLVIAFFAANLFLSGTRKGVEDQALFNQGPEQAKESLALEAVASDFNATVALVKTAQSQTFSKAEVLDHIYGLMIQSAVTPSHFTLQSGGQATLSGLTNSASHNSAFKNALTADPKIQNVVLPFSAIVPAVSGFSFTVRFQYTP